MLQKVDNDAAEIGALYNRSRAALRESLVARLECGRRLILKKDELPHGMFGMWRKANAEVLGFKSVATSSRLMKVAEEYCRENGLSLDQPIVALAKHLSNAAQAEMVARLWGHDANTNPNANRDSCDEWYTKSYVIEPARAAMGGTIHLDPASNPTAQKLVRAKKTYFKPEKASKDDPLVGGLDPKAKWYGNVWLNPPFSQPACRLFAERLLKEFDDYNVDKAVFLSLFKPGQYWWDGLAATGTVCLTGPLSFYQKDPDEKGVSPFQHAIIGLGIDPPVFEDAFGSLGLIVRQFDVFDDWSKTADPEFVKTLYELHKKEGAYEKR